MKSKKEELKDYYKVNEKEYYELFAREPINYQDYETWKIFYKSVLIHQKLNDLFEPNPFLAKLVFSNEYSRLITHKNDYGCIGNLTSFSFDHSCSIRLVMMQVKCNVRIQ